MENRHSLTFVVGDPGANANLLLFKVPDDHVYTIEAAYASIEPAVAAHATNIVSLALQNGGTSGSAADAISDTIGGTAGWASVTPKTFAITAGAGDLTAGQWLKLAYTEGGTVAPTNIAVTVEYVDGIGAKA